MIDLQLKDANERESNQRRMHEAMINCLKKDDHAIPGTSAAERAAHTEIQELRDQKKQLLDDFDKKERLLKKQITEREKLFRDLQLTVERLELEKINVSG